MRSEFIERLLQTNDNFSFRSFNNNSNDEATTKKTHFVYNNALAASPGASAKSFEKNWRLINFLKKTSFYVNVWLKTRFHRFQRHWPHNIQLCFICNAECFHKHLCRAFIHSQEANFSTIFQTVRKKNEKARINFVSTITSPLTFECARSGECFGSCIIYAKLYLEVFHLLGDELIALAAKTKFVESQIKSFIENRTQSDVSASHRTTACFKNSYTDPFFIDYALYHFQLNKTSRWTRFNGILPMWFVQAAQCPWVSNKCLLARHRIILLSKHRMLLTSCSASLSIYARR